MKKRIIVGISGASGVELGYRLLEVFHQMPEIETHLIISEGAKEIFRQESGQDAAEVSALADFTYDEKDLGAAISSGSFYTSGMVVLPCSMKTLSGIAHAYDENLLIRAADVCLKEGRKTILVPREMPLNVIHLQNMTACAQAGYVIMPPVFTFYNKPQSMEDQIDHFIGKILMQFDLFYDKFKPWKS